MLFLFYFTFILSFKKFIEIYVNQFSMSLLSFNNFEVLHSGNITKHRAPFIGIAS